MDAGTSLLTVRTGTPQCRRSSTIGHGFRSLALESLEERCVLACTSGFATPWVIVPSANGTKVVATLTESTDYFAASAWLNQNDQEWYLAFYDDDYPSLNNPCWVGSEVTPKVTAAGLIELKVNALSAVDTVDLSRISDDGVGTPIAQEFPVLVKTEVYGGENDFWRGEDLRY